MCTKIQEDVTVANPKARYTNLKPEALRHVKELNLEPSLYFNLLSFALRPIGCQKSAAIHTAK